MQKEKKEKVDHKIAYKHTYHKKIKIKNKK